MWYVQKLKVELLCKPWWGGTQSSAHAPQSWLALLQGAQGIAQGL